MNKNAIFGLLVVILVFGFLGCDNNPPLINTPKSITVKGLNDEFNDYYGEIVIFTDSPTNIDNRIATTKRIGNESNSYLSKQISAGEFTGDLYKINPDDSFNDLSIRWTDDGEYYIFILILIPYPQNLPIVYKAFLSEEKISILEEETIINFNEYNWINPYE